VAKNVLDPTPTLNQNARGKMKKIIGGEPKNGAKPSMNHIHTITPKIIDISHKYYLSIGLRCSMYCITRQKSYNATDT
jgi:hypothetical protein